MLLNTIIAAEHSKHRVAQQLLASNPRLDLLPDGSPGPRKFKIKTADTSTRRFSANALLKHRYAWRGYQTVSLPADPSIDRITLSAVDDEVTIGTITIALDSPAGLGAEEVFGAEIAALREDGKKVCEFTKLAIDPLSGTKRVIAALFHVAYIIAHRLRQHDTLVMEVNPRHVRYYERMLGARVLGEQRLNRKVNAPAVLLTIDFSYIMEQIGEFGGQEERIAEERSLYPLAFSLSQEAGMIARLMQTYAPASSRLN